MIKDLKFYFYLLNYRYFNPHAINHYNLINKLIKYKSIGKSYFVKYPTANNFINLNEELFNKNPKAKEEFLLSSKMQLQLKKSIIDEINVICKKTDQCKICSKEFQSFYIDTDYHVEQNIDLMINDIKSDIFNYIIK